MFVEPRIIEVRGLGPVAIYPVRVRQLQRYMRAIKAVVPFLMAGDFMEAWSRYAAEVVEVIHAGTDLTKGQVEALSPSAVMQVFRCVVETNANFFVARVLPEMVLLQNSLRAIMDGASASPFSDGSASDMPKRLN